MMHSMTELRTVLTASLDDALQGEVRRLMTGAFGTVSDDTFENVLGGTHVLVVEGPELIGHASIVQRRLIHGGRALRTGYIEGVAVRADRRRRGHGDAMMAILEPMIRHSYQLGALGASAEGAALYSSRGWLRWQGTTSMLTPEGIRPTPDGDGAVYVLPVRVPLDVTGELTCDWRHGSAW
jgi:aminoglycoside 2'-N-acetyltransferase I